jgi:hypothetical protein
LLDQLGAAQFDAVAHLLETMVSSEEDTGTLSHAEHGAVTQADEWLNHNRPIRHEEILAEFGLTMADWERMGKNQLPREQAHELIDCLPEMQVSALVGLLKSIADPVATALRNAPIDDEPETGDEKQSVAEAQDWLARRGGKGIPHCEAMRRLGLE